MPKEDTQWKPGQSGNPKGKPRGKHLSSKLRELLECNKIGDTRFPDGLTLGDMLLRVLVKNALEGQDIRFIREIFDRAEGKPVQMLGLDRDAGSSIELIIRTDNGETLSFGEEEAPPIGVPGSQHIGLPGIHGDDGELEPDA